MVFGLSVPRMYNCPWCTECVRHRHCTAVHHGLGGIGRCLPVGVDQRCRSSMSLDVVRRRSTTMYHGLWLLGWYTTGLCQKSIKYQAVRSGNSVRRATVYGVGTVYGGMPQCTEGNSVRRDATVSVYGREQCRCTACTAVYGTVRLRLRYT